MSNRHRYTHYAEKTNTQHSSGLSFIRLRAVCQDRRAGQDNRRAKNNRSDELLLETPGEAGEEAQLDTVGAEIPGDGDERRSKGPRSHGVARVQIQAVLMAVGGIWRADPFLVGAVNVTGSVDPGAEIEIFQRHKVVAANLVFRGHLVKLCGEEKGGGRGGAFGGSA